MRFSITPDDAAQTHPAHTAMRASTVAFLGIDVVEVDVQVQIAPGLPGFALVGLADKAVGVSTFERDPIGGFALKSDDFRRMGEMIAGAGRPTLFVMEGGYAIEELGLNVANLLGAYEAAAR